MQITCHKCSTLIAASNINLTTLFAKCGQCDHVFSIAYYFARPLQLQPAPKRLLVEKDSDALLLRWAWLNPRVVKLIALTIFWNGLIFSNFVARSDAVPELYLSPFLIILLFAGLWLIYETLSSLFNKTTIVVDPKKLVVRSRPFPKFSGKRVVSADIQQLYVKESMVRGRRNEIGYDLYALHGANQPLQLVSGLDSAELALYIESEIELFLNIEDVPIHGEIAR